MQPTKTIEKPENTTKPTENKKCTQCTHKKNSQTGYTPFEPLWSLIEQPMEKMYSKTKKRTFEYTFHRRNDHDIERALQITSTSPTTYKKQ